MSTLVVVITFKDGSCRTISNVTSFRYVIESYRYKSLGPFFELREILYDVFDIVDSTIHVFSLDSIDSIEVF